VVDDDLAISNDATSSADEAIQILLVPVASPGTPVAAGVNEASANTDI
jgi:hypothetical protein